MGHIALRHMGVQTLQNYYTANKLYSIGVPGTQGFGVGVCPTAVLPAGMTPLYGHDQVQHPNYGNYQFSDGSVMVFVPCFYYRIASTLSPNYATYGVNSMDILGVNTFTSETEANAQGYALHRAFIDGGAVKAGFFFDKYMTSKNALGTGYVASSILNGLPLSSAATHNPFSGLTGGADFYYSAVDLPHRRDGSNGNVNASSIFHCASIFQRSAIAMLATAHGQSAAVNGTGTTNCAWYHATYNFPKGLNNNQAPVAGTISSADVNDTAITFTSDGYSNCGKTGSGSPFAKTTHNGQTCGIADVNGLMWEISIGATCIASTKTVVGATKANPCVVELNNTTGMVDGYVMLTSIVGMTQLNNKIYLCTITDGTHITLTGIDSSAYGAYVSGGTATYGKWYVAKQATAMKTFTSGNSAATDHWGATGVAAMMEEFTPVFETSGGGAFAQRMGSGSNQVLSSSLSGSGWLLAGMGFPKDENGIDTTVTDLFGKDYYYQYLRNEICLLSSGYWSDTTGAGVWGVDWHGYRTASNGNGGLRAACYPT